MRKTKLIFGLGALLLAGAGAFAHAKTYGPTQVWYRETASSPCIDTNLDIECETGGTGCVGQNPGSPSFGKQLYDERECEIPLKVTEL